MIPRSAQLAALLVVLAASTAAGQTAAGDPHGEAGGARALPADAGLPAAVPESAGMSSEGLARIDPAMQSYVDDGRLAGVMTLVARRGQVVHWEATGMRDAAAGDPLEPNDIFRIYSMTKPLTSVAVMILVEEGAGHARRPGLEVHSGVRRRDGAERSRQARGAGPADDRRAPADPHVWPHLRISSATRRSTGSTTNRVSSLPRRASTTSPAGWRRSRCWPATGDRWNYSVSTDILGRVVEAASGQAFDAFLQARIFDPLDMADTSFVVPLEKRNRFTAHYARPDGTLQTIRLAGRRPVHAAAALAVGRGRTRLDRVRLRPLRARCSCRTGNSTVVRILEPETVRMMRSNRLTDALVPIQLGTFLSPGYGFGLGFAVVVDADASPEPDNDGVFRLGRRREHLLLDRPRGRADRHGLDPVQPVRGPTTSSASSRRSSTKRWSSHSRMTSAEICIFSADLPHYNSSRG